MYIKLLIIVFAFAFGVQSYVRDRYNICNTQDCKDMANLIINSINKTADPCNDFYNYACGSWSTNNPVPKGKLVWNQGEQISNNIQDSLIKILQEEPKSEDSVPLSLEKKLFKACMDEDRIEIRELEGLSKIIENNGGWPMVNDKWNDKDFPWQKVAKGYMEYNMAGGLFSVSIMPDFRNSSIKLISLIQGRGLFLNKQFTNILTKLLNDANYEVEKFYKLLEFFLQLPRFYANYRKYEVNPTILSNETIAMMQFISDLQSIRPLDNEIDLTDKNITISEFQKYYNYKNPHKGTSKINWLLFIRTFLKDTNINIDNSEQIVIGDKSYFDKLFVLLERTPHKTIVNYLHWNFLLSTLIYLNKEARQLAAQYNSIVTGIIPNTKTRSEECVQSQLLKDGVTKEYLKQHFPESSSISIKGLAEDIRKEIGNNILRTSWMDIKTKLLAREKLRAMKLQIGYPEYYKNEAEFSKIYKGLEIGQDHFDNTMAILKLASLEALKAFREPFDRDMWFTSPLTVNAYNLLQFNNVVIPAAQLSIPNYSENGPISANYGSVGFIVGHEMSHGFDVLGYMFDKNGNSIPWWSHKVVNDFKTKAYCFITQYDSYGVNGKLTQSENIADCSGLNAAFTAYTKRASKDRNFKLPNLEDVTQAQLFFLSFANTFCHSTTSQYEERMKNDVHTKTPLRINAAVANVKGFAEAFQCSKNSALNPEKRCNIWE